MKTSTLISFCLLLSFGLMAQQVPLGFNYQTIIRNIDTDEPLRNTEVVLSFNIRNFSAEGAIIYQETDTLTTDQFGLISHVIGQGTSDFEFSTIDWSINPKFLEIAAQIEGQLQSMGNVQLWSVPYALYAQNTLGPAQDGSSWLVGPTNPTNDLGEDDDLFLNSSTGDFFQRVSGTWIFQGNLNGPAGTPGADGAGITQITDNGNGTLTIEYGNGSSLTTGDLSGQPGEDGIGITEIINNADGTLTINYGDGESITTDTLTGPIGPAGDDGIGITEIIPNANGSLTINYGNGNSVTTASLIGEPGEPGENGADGEDGIGITEIIANPDGSLTINYGNGNSITTESLMGEPGEPGENGQDGAGISEITINPDNSLTINYGNGNSVTTEPILGPPGADGEDGVGITEIIMNPDGSLTINYGDGNSVTTESLMGEPGENGQDGAGITEIITNPDNSLTISYGNGNSVTTEPIVGPPGADGEDGEDGVGITEITTNPDGSLTINYGDGDSVSTESLIGEPGEPGENGQNGEDGATWLTGSTDPDPSLGNDGDFYFQSDGHYYQKEGGAWTNLGLVDVNPDNDVLITTEAGGEVEGTFDNLQIATGAIGLSNFSDMGATGSGSIMQWNGSEWELNSSAILNYEPGTGISINGNVISALNEEDIWNANALRGRPIGGMPQSGNSYFMVINGATDQYEPVQLDGDVTGDFNDLTLQKIKGRPIGGMPQSGNSYFFVLNGDTDQYEPVQLQGDVTGDFNDMTLQRIKGRPIGGMPQSGNSYFMVINGDTDEYDLVQLQGDVSGDFDDLQLNFPLQKGGDFTNQSMVDLTNLGETEDSYGFRALTMGQRNYIFDEPNDVFLLDDFNETYPAGLYGESDNGGNNGVAGAGVLGRSVNGGINTGVGGWFQGNSIGTIGTAYEDGLAGVVGLSGIDGDEGARYGGLFLGASNDVGDNAALRVSEAGATFAGYFEGDVFISGNIDMLTQFNAADKFFRIDHPLTPTEKYLYHSTVESPERKNIYDGVVTTDANGYATVQLPEYFEALNTEFRYQLTVIGVFAQAIIAEKIADKRFVIRTDQPNIEVSWQVTGVRQDAYARNHPFEAEVDKPAEKQGTYLHPEAFGAEKSEAQYPTTDWQSVRKQQK